MSNEQAQSFDSLKTRLDEIANSVAVPTISLDEALDLYEEAIKLGMQASSLLEEDISADQILSCTTTNKNGPESSENASLGVSEELATEATLEASFEATAEDGLPDEL